MKTVKCTVVGDSGVGKSALIRTFTSGEFPGECEPIIFDTFLTHITVDGKNCQLSLWYTNGMEEFNRFRPLSYPGSNVVLICFSIEFRASFESVAEKWAAEIKEYCPNTPIILVGLKQDLRHNLTNNRGTLHAEILDVDGDENSFHSKDMKEKEAEAGTDFVTSHEASQLANKLGFLNYIEVSSLTQYNLSTLFVEAVRDAAPTPTISDSEEPKNVMQQCKGCTIA